LREGKTETQFNADMSQPGNEEKRKVRNGWTESRGGKKRTLAIP